MHRNDLGIPNDTGGPMTSAGQVASPFRSPQQRREDQHAKRQAVLAVAVRTFNDRGFQGTSLDDVAAALGISKRTIYYYFDSKEQVLLECMKIGLNKLTDALGTVRKVPGSGRDRLCAFLRRFAELTMEDFGRCVARTGEEALSPEGARFFRDVKRKIDFEMRRLIEEGIADGSIAALDPRMAAFTLAGAINWTARWHQPGASMTPEAIAEAMVDILARGFHPR